jgi:hypothetical protein
VKLQGCGLGSERKRVRKKEAITVKKLIVGIAEARNVAADREADIRVNEFLRAISIRSGGYDPEHLTLEVACHFRSWQKCVTTVQATGLDKMSTDGLAETTAGWVQDAIKGDLLSLSNCRLMAGWNCVRLDPL